jgi:hypothetical protein
MQQRNAVQRESRESVACCGRHVVVALGEINLQWLQLNSLLLIGWASFVRFPPPVETRPSPRQMLRDATQNRK